MLEMVKNHRYREDLYENIIIKRDFEIDTEERNAIKVILMYEVLSKAALKKIFGKEILIYQ